MSVMLISIMFVNMTSAAQIKDIKGTRVERQYSNHYSAQFNELWDSFGRSEISIYDINYNIIHIIQLHLMILMEETVQDMRFY